MQVAKIQTGKTKKKALLQKHKKGLICNIKFVRKNHVARKKLKMPEKVNKTSQRTAFTYLFLQARGKLIRKNHKCRHGYRALQAGQLFVDEI